MRLLIDARPLVDPKSGGVARLSRCLVNAYARIFPEDELVLATTGSAEPALPSEFEQPNMKRIHFRTPNKWWSALSILGRTSLTRSVESRVGHVDATFLPNLGFVGQLRSPTALLLHDLSFLIEPRWFNAKQRAWHRAVRAPQLIRRADHLFAVSKRTKQDAIDILGIPEERITVIPVGATLAVALPSDSEGEDTRPTPTERYVLALGWNDRRKNAALADVAVEALRRDPAYADVTCRVVGRDVQRPTDEELVTLYANAAAFLYPSWYEGYGLPLWEAAQYGTPCIASSSAALPETAPHGTLFAHPAKPHQWTEALRIALASERKPLFPETTWESAARTVRRTMLR